MRRLGLALCLSAAPAAAQVLPVPGPDPTVEPPELNARIDGHLRLRQRLMKALGTGALGWGTLLDESGAGVLVRTRRALTAAEAADLQLKPSGVSDTIYAGQIAWDRLEWLASWPVIERIEPGRRALQLKPLDTIGARQGSLRAHLRPEDGLTGDGVVVAAIDSPVDVLHPHFFHADGGVYDWLDANNSGAFEPGDAVLFDDGSVGRLQVMDGLFFDPVTDLAMWQNIDGVLDPRRDWLFADLNGDGIRNAGAAAGFTDDDPSFGEPLFLAHDPNGNGRLDPDEKLFALGTSKIRQLWVRARTFRRGENMVEAGDLTANFDASHGTGVASILLGGQPGFHDRVGLAPGAEYVGYAEVDEGRMGLVFADAAEQGAVLMLHEWSQPVGEVGDGGSIFEASMDAARDRGMLQVCPLGNLNSAGKQIELSADGPVELAFTVGDGFFNGQQQLPYGYVQAHVAWGSDARPESMQIVRPDGTARDLDLSGNPVQLNGDTAVAGVFDLTPRGSRRLDVILFRGDGFSDTLEQGTWTIRLTGLPEGTGVHGRITDAWSGWSEGVGWERPTRDRTSLTYPSTADSAIGVAAFGGRWDMREYGDSDVGELRHYSGRGPRIDGAPVVDIAAPDDPLAAMATGPRLDFPLGHSSAFTMFGGTSGAGPHVAATVALLKAQDPTRDPDAIEALLYGGSGVDGLIPDLGALPNAGWGHGKLALHQVLYGAPTPIGNAAPVIEAIEFEQGVEDVNRLRAVATDAEGDALHTRWDLEYDGSWDSDWLTDGLTLRPQTWVPGTQLTVRAVVRDSLGGSAEQIVTLTVPEPFEVEPIEPRPEPEPQPEVMPDGGVIDMGDGKPEEPPTDQERSARSSGGCVAAPGQRETSAGWMLALLGLGWMRRQRAKSS